jgi:group I intron endonuclease
MEFIMAYGVVYLVTNNVTGVEYVGQTVHGIARRWSHHVAAAASSRYTSPLLRAINKYGKESFSIIILQECTSKDELDLTEQKFILERGTTSPRGYNLLLGGSSKRHSDPETIKKITSRFAKYEYRGQWLTARQLYSLPEATQQASVVTRRLKSGVPAHKAIDAMDPNFLTEKAENYRHAKRTVLYNGVMYSCVEIHSKFVKDDKITYTVLQRRIKEGMSVDDAIFKPVGTHYKAKTLEPRGSNPMTGVSWHVGQDRWMVRVKRGGKRVLVGYYLTKQEAMEARKLAQEDIPRK